MTNTTLEKAIAHLEAQAPGAFQAYINYTLEHAGSVHIAPDIVALVIPALDEPPTCRFVYQTSTIPALYHYACHLRKTYTHVQLSRGLRLGEKAKVRTVLADTIIAKLKYQAEKTQP